MNYYSIILVLCVCVFVISKTEIVCNAELGFESE